MFLFLWTPPLLAGPPERNELNRLEPKKARMTKQWRMRLDKIKRQIAERNRKIAQKRNEDYAKDPRGEPELRICSVNLNDLGMKRDVKRFAEERSIKSLRRKERSVVRAIQSTNCDVVALQALLGRDRVSQRAALDRLIKKLMKNSDEGWEGVLGKSHQRFSANAFLIREGRAQLVKTIFHDRKRLPRFDEFRFKRFTRSPLEIVLQVGRDRKQVHLFTFQFHGKLIADVPAQEPSRMQMADALRQLVLFREAKVDPKDPAILVLLGEGAAPRSSPSAKILEGRIALKQFQQGGPCKLVEPASFSCDPKPKNIVTLPSLFRSQLPDKVEIVKRAVEPEEEEEEKQFAYFKKPLSDNDIIRAKNEKLLQTVDIYMTNTDLPYAWEHQRSPGRFKIGKVPVENNLPGSPLVWVELNW